ncbi:MAG: hypothetical protein JWN12_823 [Candidatus Saccharibacteria bacterium]|nr:hypothetical protein [Candidatus Saccharibacteria bacterium]
MHTFYAILYASDVIHQTKTHLSDQPKIAQEHRMTQASPERNFNSREDTLLKNTSDIPVVPITSDTIIPGYDSVEPIEVSPFHGPTEREEQNIFLGRQAANLALAIGVSNDPDVKVREVERFLGNAGYPESHTPTVALSQQDFVTSIIDNIEMKTKTETAAALKAQNEALRQQIEDIKETLEAKLSKEALLAIAPFLKLPEGVDIDVEEFASEVQDALISTHDLEVPSTAELEAQLALESDNTHSPVSGITIAKIGHWTVDILKKSLK